MRKLLAAICFTLSILALQVLAFGEGKERLELPNPSFESGADGYWMSNQSVAAIDAETSTAGAHSLCLFPGASQVDAVFFVPFRKDMAYRLSFDCKGSDGAKAPSLGLSAMLQGSAPIMFWERPASSDAPAKIIPATKWTRYETVLGPFPSEAQGKVVMTVGLFLSAVGSSPQGKLWIDNISVEIEPYVPQENKGKGEEKDKKPQASADPKQLQDGKDVKSTEKKEDIVKAATSGGQDLIRIELPDPVRIFERPVTLKITAPASDGGTLKLEISDFKGRIRDSFTADANTGIETLISTPGYYSASVSLTKDGNIVETKSTSFLVASPLPADYYSTPHPAFGVWGVPGGEMMRIAGAKWTRLLFWPQFQPKDFAGTPPSPEKLKARSPVKVIKNLNVLNAFKKMGPVAKEDWPEILEKMGRQIVADRGLVDVWETQNEPMVGENFHGSMEDVMEIISTQSRLVRELDPGTPLAGICINPMSANQYAQYIGYYKRLGIARVIDAVMLHPYIPNAASPDNSGYVETLKRLSRELKEITGKDVPLYISEIGYSTKPGGEVSEIEQAAYLARVVLLNRQVEELKACVWHIGLYNDPRGPQRERDFSILRGHPEKSPIREPKPAFAAWATVSRQTYNAEYVGELEFGRGVRVFLFSRNSCPLLAAYSLSKTRKTLKIPLGGGKITVTDLCGTSVELPTSSGVVQLEVDESPSYIAGFDPEDVKRLGRLKVIFTPEELKARPGQDVHLAMSGTPLALEGSEIKVETPAGWTVSFSGSGESRDITLAVPSNALPGEQTLFIHLLKDGESKHIWRREMQILPPVELSDMKLVPGADGSSTLSFLPVGAGLKEIRVDLLEDDKPLASGKVEVGRAAAIKTPALSFGRPHIYSALVDAGNGYKWKTPLLTLNQFPILKAKSGAAVSKQAGFDLAGGEYSKGSIEGAIDRPTGRLRLGWNESSLFLRVETLDRWHVVKELPEELWAADSLQIGVSVKQDEMIHPNNDGIQETLYSEFGVMASRDGECVSNVWASSNRNLSELGKKLPGMKGRWSRTGDTTVYELEIPWQSLNVKNPRLGMHIKFSLLINDADESKQRHWLEWYSGIGNGKDISLYGEGVLATETPDAGK
ncbi:MAG: sugar-binding protein [Victivallales bacterium]